jgi:hypothetical protein
LVFKEKRSPKKSLFETMKLQIFVFLVFLFGIQYSLVFEDARVQVYNNLVRHDAWIAPEFAHYQYSWFTPTYLKVCAYFVWIPLTKLYLHGPAWGSVGFWQGKSKRDICSALTGVDAEFWIGENMLKCDETIWRKVESFLTISHVVFVLMLCVIAVYWMLTNWFYTRLVTQILNHPFFLEFRRSSRSLTQSASKTL